MTGTRPDLFRDASHSSTRFRPSKVSGRYHSEECPWPIPTSSSLQRTQSTEEHHSNSFFNRSPYRNSSSTRASIPAQLPTVESGNAGDCFSPVRTIRPQLTPSRRHPPTADTSNDAFNFLASMNDIRVFVTFPTSTAVFAGETVQCKITFKNVAPESRTGPNPLSHSAVNLPGLGINGVASAERRNRQLPIPSDGRRSGRVSPRLPPGHSPGRKPSGSLPGPPPKTPISPLPQPNGRPPQGHKHKRSVSIVSLNSDAGLESGTTGRGNAAQRGDANINRSPAANGRPRGHGRSASLHILPRRTSGMSATPAPGSVTPVSARSSQPPTPMIVESEPMSNFVFPPTPNVSGTPVVAPPRPKHNRSQSINEAYKFPPSPATASGPSENNGMPGRMQNLSVDLKGIQDADGVSRISLHSPGGHSEYDSISPGRLLPGQNINETPRSSAEFYSLSNSTNETLLSEYEPKSRHRTPSHNRRHSLLSVSARSSSSESLMMGYAQVMGSFVVDGSLMQTGIFDEVKRRGIVGTQMGGGVVGVETSKADGGFLSGWMGGWGGLLGGNNMSTIAEMKNIASTKSVPVLSTPHSILFVDLRLAPGESKSYMYKFKLPSGLPPSHKGKAIKITYNIVIGTQRPGKGVQQPKVVEVPFRVFPNVEVNGSMPTYDLTSPIVLLRDEATTLCLDEQGGWRTSPIPKRDTKQESSLDDFMSYVDSLLAAAEDSASNSLRVLSPSAGPNEGKRLSIYDDQPTSSKDAVELAIQGALSRWTNANQSFMFEIARNGQRVASVCLARPAYKLGETITAVINFSNCEISCYHINASLESSETIDPSLALRSPASIHRATRRIYSQHSESTLFAKRVIFSATIPTTGTPEFSTSGVSNYWVVRLEFITAMISGRQEDMAADELLEQTYADDRGELYEPRQGILVESFDASIPVKVYPNGADPGIGAATASQTAASVGYPV